MTVTTTQVHLETTRLYTSQNCFQARAWTHNSQRCKPRRGLRVVKVTHQKCFHTNTVRIRSYHQIEWAPLGYGGILTICNKSKEILTSFYACDCCITRMQSSLLTVILATVTLFLQQTRMESRSFPSDFIDDNDTS